MSRYIAKAAIRGATTIVDEAERMLAAAIDDFGADTPVAFTNTAYHLPVILGFTGMEVDNLGQLQKALDQAKKLLNDAPGDSLWLPYLGETLDSGAATLLAAEAIEAVRFVRGEQPERIPGLQLTGTSFVSPGREWWRRLRQRPHRRHPVARLGHPVGRRPHARFRRHRGRGPQQRGRGVDRARAAEAQHPRVPLGQRERAQHHPSADGRGRRDGLRHLHRARSAPTPSRPSTRWASPPARRSPSAACPAARSATSCCTTSSGCSPSCSRWARWTT